MVRVVLCCLDCRESLVQAGATVDESPRTITPGFCCEVHPTSRHAQAMHAVQASAEVLETWAANEKTAESFRGLTEPDPDWPLVAQVAAQLLARGDEAIGDDSILMATGHARQIIAAAKGG